MTPAAIARTLTVISHAAIVVGVLCSRPTLLAQRPSGVPDLSGNWSVGSGGVSWDPSDPSGTRPEGLPMTPWALERFKAARPVFGAKQEFGDPTDPLQKYCDPPGAVRLYALVWQFNIVQTPASVYMLFEYARAWRVIAMDRGHPADPDPSWFGDSVGKYEGGALVIDTIGFNDRSWLDNVGHPHSEALHTVERLRRVSRDTLELEITFDDPKAYTKSWTAKRTFKLSPYPTSEKMCSLSENQAFQKSVMDRLALPAPAK